MKVNLLQGTCTPTLTPMPGVHNAVLVTAACLRFGMNVKSHVRAAARDGERWTKSRDAMELGVRSGSVARGIW